MAFPKAVSVKSSPWSAFHFCAHVSSHRTQLGQDSMWPGIPRFHKGVLTGPTFRGSHDGSAFAHTLSLPGIL